MLRILAGGLAVILATIAVSALIIARLPGAMEPDRNASRTWLIEHATLFDPDAGTRQAGQSVLVQDGQIARVGPDGMSGIGPDIPRIDAQGRTLMPGLIDMHVHVFDEVDLAAGLAHGVTTVRNMGGMPFHLPLAARIDAGRLYGPRLITTGAIINERGGRNANLLHEVVSGGDEARAAVRRQYAAGFRHLKLYSNLSRESFAAIREEAAALGMTMSGHPVEGTQDDPLPFTDTLPADFATIEHTESIVWHGLSDHTDPEGAQTLAQAVAAASATVDPTLVVHENLARIVETRGAHLLRPEMEGYNPVVAGFERDTFDFWSRYVHEDRTQMQAFYEAFTGMMHEAGVRLTVGSDSGIMASPHGVSTVREIELLVRAGLTPLEAIRSATVHPADVLGLDGKIGCVAVGCFADLVLVDGDPLTSPSILYAPRGVMRDGRWLDRDALDALEEAGRQPSELRTWWRLGRHLLAIG